MGWGRSKASGPFLSQSCSHCLRSPCKYVFPLCGGMFVVPAQSQKAGSRENCPGRDQV